MCSSEELIHDARQITLEEMIMTNETPMYLVPGRLTDEQRERFILDTDCAIAEIAIANLGTPIQPCADVETVGYLTIFPSGFVGFTDEKSVADRRELKGSRNFSLVRRTDMEAQVALAYEKGWSAGKRDASNRQVRAAAEKDAEIARLLAKQPLYDRAVHENGELKLAVARLQAQEDKALTQVIEERDECERVISDLYHAAMGEYPEWSNNFGYRDAVEDVVDYVHALRTKALNGRALHG